MSKNHRWKSRIPSDVEQAEKRAPEDEPVHLDVDRLQASLQSARFVMPSNLTPEQKVQFMLDVANGHR